MRPRGRAIQEGCGKWNTVSSKHRMGEAEIMPRCAHCSRKKRLTPNNTDVHLFDNRDDAIHREELLNASVLSSPSPLQEKEREFLETLQATMSDIEQGGI